MIFKEMIPYCNASIPLSNAGMHYLKRKCIILYTEVTYNHNDFMCAREQIQY